MFEISVVGIGNAGSQVAALAKQKLAVDALALNSCEDDLATVPNIIMKRVLGDGKGSGKNREASLEFLEKSIAALINDEEVASVLKKDIVFIVSSTGGGTGSGASLVLTNVMQKLLPFAKVITVAILPALKEGYSTQVNTTCYLKDLYEKMDKATYMIYDNEKASKYSTPQMMESINESIVKDIDVIRGTYQVQTRYSSIDTRDMENIISTNGRLVVASLRDLKEKDLDDTSYDDLLINEIKTNAHCELQRDKIVIRTGVIVNLSDRMMESFDSHLGKVQEFIGSPVEEFEHIAINNDRHLPNNVFLVASGLTQINDRIRKINDRIEEIDEMRKQKEEESEINNVDIDSLTAKIVRPQETESPDQVDILNIFSKFKN